MKKSLIVSGMVAGLLLGSFNVQAVPVAVCRYQPRPGMTGRAQDLGRSIVGFISSIIELCGEGESKAQLIATQEEDNANACGGSGSSSGTNTSSGSLSNSLGSAGDSEYTGSAYDYVNANVIAKEGNVGYTALKTAIASGSTGASVRENIEKVIKEEFFADPEESDQSTTEYQEKIRTQRNKYVQEAANRHVTLGYRVKGHIQNDLGVIASVSLTGDGELGAIAVDAHTLEQMVKMELVDLALQIEMMEADAIQFLMHQPVILMSETKPTGSN